MRLTFIIVLSCCLFFLHAGDYDYISQYPFSRPDTVSPPPPPGGPAPISGPSAACVGDISEYSVDVPVACICQWAVNGIIQPDTISPLLITWTQSGLQMVSVIFVCAGGQISDPTFKNVLVLYQPDVFLGNDTTILQGQTLMLDAANPGSEYLWSTGETTQTLPVSVSGTYTVNVSNFCGADTDTIEVSVIVGIFENEDPGDCFRVILHNRKISFPDLPQGSLRMQVINLSGIICYDGTPVSEIAVAHPGIYLIRMISVETICHKKVFIP